MFSLKAFSIDQRKYDHRGAGIARGPGTEEEAYEFISFAAGLGSKGLSYVLRRKFQPGVHFLAHFSS